MFYIIQDIVLGGWVLKHAAGDKETVYKFHRNLKLPAGHFVTVSIIDIVECWNIMCSLIIRYHPMPLFCMKEIILKS